MRIMGLVSGGLEQQPDLLHLVLLEQIHDADDLIVFHVFIGSYHHRALRIIF